MENDNSALYEHVICEYRQALSDTQINLALANAQGTIKDQRIDELTRQLEAARESTGAPAPKSAPPKPGPINI